MPYQLRDDHPDCSGYAVVYANDTAKIVPGGCHPTKKEALGHLAALNINVAAAVLAEAGPDPHPLAPFTVKENHPSCPATHPHGTVDKDGTLVLCHKRKAEAQDLALQLSFPDVTEAPGAGTADDPAVTAGDTGGTSGGTVGAASPGEAEHPGDTERLRHYWTHGEGGAKIGWGTPGDFDRCVAELAKYIRDPKGYCNLRHHEATGMWPAQHAELIHGGHKAARGAAYNGDHPDTVSWENVELVAAGEWRLSTGTSSFTTADLQSAVGAADCPAVGDPVLKLGHLDPRFQFDGEPAIGRATNLRLNESQTKIVGDFTGMPRWLAEILPSAYPQRSIEGTWDFKCQNGHTHRFVITAVALLGVTPPGVGMIESLADVATLYGAEASARRARADLGGDVEHWIDEARDSHGRWTKGGDTGKVAKTAEDAGKAAGHLPWTAEGDTAKYAGSLGIDRADMPQLSGLIDGTYHPSAEMTPKFITQLRGKGVAVESTRVPAASLKPTQTTGDMRAITRIAEQLRSGELKDTKPVIVSSDNRVLDGHHNWAGRVLADSEGGRKGLDPGMPVHKVDMPMNQLLGEAQAFGKEQGLPARKAGEFVGPKAHYGAPQPVDSLAKYTRADGTLTPEREALHQQIIDHILAGVTKPEGKPVATFFGGGPASGKSSLKGPANAAKIDPDEIKGMLPEYQAMIKAGDPMAAAYSHEESSALSKKVMAAARSKGVNFILDGTGDSAYSKMAGKVNAARAAGYEVHGKYVTVDIPTAITRAEERAKTTGRMVAPSVIHSTHVAVSDTFDQAVKNGLFDSAELWDNNGEGKAQLIFTAQGKQAQILDTKAWQRFLAKAQESFTPAQQPAAPAAAAPTQHTPLIPGADMPPDGSAALAAGTVTTIDDVRREFYEEAPWSQWIIEVQLSGDGPVLIVCDDSTGQLYRVPVKIDPKQPGEVEFGASTAVLVNYIDAPNQSAEASKMAFPPDRTIRAAWGSRDASREGFAHAAWDAAAQLRNLGDNPSQSQINALFALPGDNKSDSKLPHHTVSSDGKVGGPDPDGCQAALNAINGSRGGLKGVSSDDLKKAYNHVAAHLRALGKEPADFNAAAAAEAAGRRLDWLRKVRAAVGTPDTDADDNTNSLVASLDALLDQASALAAKVDKTRVPEEAAQVLDLVTAAESVADQLMELLGIYDPDDAEGVAAAGPHGPYTGRHSHPHAAMGAQGADETHDHMHSHSNDASHNHDHAPAPPAPPPSAARGQAAGTAGTEGAPEVEFTNDQLAAIRAKLGKKDGEEVTADDIAGAFTAAASVAASGPVGKPDEEHGVYLVEASIIDDWRKRAESGDQAVRELRRNERDTILAAAIRDGKFPQSRLEHWQRAWEHDPEGTRAQVASLASGLVPVGGPVGAPGIDPDLPGDFEEQMAYKRLYPEDAQAARGGASRG